MCSQEPVIGLYPEPDESIRQPHNPVSLKHIFILSSSLHVGLPRGPFSSDLHFSLLSCGLYASLVSSFWIWSLYWWMESVCKMWTQITVMKMVESQEEREDTLKGLSELLGFWHLSIFIYSKNTKERNVSETESVSVINWGEETPTLLGPLERANLSLSQWLRLALSNGSNRVRVSPPPSREDGNSSSFRNVVSYSVFGMPDDGQSPESQ
jgi:hypothetical protein